MVILLVVWLEIYLTVTYSINMDVEKIRELKAELDSKLSDLVVGFENATGLEISTIVVKRQVSDEGDTIEVSTRAII